MANVYLHFRIVFCSQVQYSILLENGTIPESTIEDVVQAGESTVLLQDLQKFTAYQIVVWPFNKAGNGPFERTEALTLEDRK